MNNLSGFLSFHGNISGQMGSNLITNVEANPAGTPTEILTSIRVGDIIYSIPSGGGGTNNYNDLLNKPTINGYTLSGAVSLSDIGAEPTISYSGNLIQYMDGTGNFTIPNYNNIQNRPQINGHVLTGDQSSDDLDLQDKIIYPEDITQFLDGTGTFRTPDYFSGDYDDLTDKPSINGVTLEGDKSSSDLHLVSEVHDVGPAAEVNFEADDTLPLLSCTCDIVASQSGSGTPSPDNPRPISGHSSITVTIASTSGGSGDDTTVSLGRTVYGGTLDVTTGELTVMKADVNLSQQTLSYTKFTTGTSDRFYVRLSNYISNVMIDGFNDIESDYFDAKMQSTNEVGTTYMENGYLNMNMTQGLFADATAFKTWIESESVHLVYELATPQTFNLTPTQVKTLLGQNYVRCDTGDIQVTYATNIVDPLLKWLLENS